MVDYHYNKEINKSIGRMRELRPELFEAFVDFDSKVFKEGLLNTKVKELIAVAAAHITQCPYCIAAHTKRAKKAGVSDGELAEAIFVAMAIRAGGSFAHSAIAMETLEG